MRENERNERWMLILSHTAHPLYYVLHSPDALPASPDALTASPDALPASPDAVLFLRYKIGNGYSFR